MKKGKKVHLGPQLFRGEGGGHSQKEGIFLICDNDISHPKCSLQVDALNFKHLIEHVESLYLNHQNLRIY